MVVPFVLALVVGGALAGDASLRSGKISPDLKPKSDEKFMEKDYPEDMRGGVKSVFTHPFPAVQDSDEYDQDLVKDENTDNGMWKAQSEYDNLRSKVWKTKDDVKKAQAKVYEEEAEYHVAQEKEAGYERDAVQAEKDADEADTTESAANKDADAAGDKVAGASDGAEDETMSLEECQEKLKKMRGRVATAEKEKEDARLGEAQEREDRANGVAHADSDRALAEGHVAEAAEKRALADAKYNHKKETYASACAKYDAEVEALNKMEKKLEDAEERLVDFRKDNNRGGVYRTEEEQEESPQEQEEREIKEGVHHAIKGGASRAPATAALVGAAAMWFVVA